MSTHAIQPGRCNFPVNMPVEMRREIGRLATMHGQSTGAYIRGLIEQSIADAKGRGLEILRDARQTVLPLAACLTIACGLAATIISAAIGENQLRRPTCQRVATSIRTVRAARREGEGA